MTRAIDEVLDDLGQPLDRGRVKQVDTGGGRKADYLETYDIINAANRIFGYDGWSYRIIGGPSYMEAAGVYTAEVEVTVMDVRRADIGTNTLVQPRNGPPQPSHHEMSMKGAVSDALKRALRSFGAQFGNDLYDKTPDAQQGQQAGAARPPQARPQQQAARPAQTAPAATRGFQEPASPTAPGGMTTAGDFYSWAFTQQGLGHDAADGLLGLKKGEPLGDPNEARAMVEAKLKEIEAKGATTNG